MIIYYASPIDQANSPGPAADTIQAVAAKVVDLAVYPNLLTVFNPASGWRTSAKPEPYMQEANLAVLDQADLLLAVLPMGVPTIGVVLEINHAILSKIPVIIFSDLTEQSWALSWLADHDDVTVIPFDPQRHVTSGSKLMDEILATQRRRANIAEKVAAATAEFAIDLGNSMVHTPVKNEHDIDPFS